MLTKGLMSGTSLDGVDGVLARFDAREGLAVLAHVHHAMPSELQCEFLALNNSGVDELHRAALAGNALARRRCHRKFLALRSCRSYHHRRRRRRKTVGCLRSGRSDGHRDHRALAAGCRPTKRYRVRW